MADAGRGRGPVLAGPAGPAVPQCDGPGSRADGRVFADPVRVLPHPPDLRCRLPGWRQPLHPRGGPADHRVAVAVVLRAHAGDGALQRRIVDAVPEHHEQHAEQPGVLLRTDPFPGRGRSGPPRFFPDADDLRAGLLPAGLLHQYLSAAGARRQLGRPADQWTVRAAGHPGGQPSSLPDSGGIPQPAAHHRCRRTIDAAIAADAGGASGRAPAADPGHGRLHRLPARLCPAQRAEPGGDPAPARRAGKTGTA